MRITDFLKEERVLLDLNATSKEEAIKEIANVLKNSEEVVDFDLFLKEIFDRESLSTTGIGNYIGIPHARTDAVNRFVIAFGRSSNGIEFNSVDGKPAKLIFLMGTPKEKGLNSYLEILAHLTRLLNKKELQEVLLNATSPKDIIEAFKNVEH